MSWLAGRLGCGRTKARGKGCGRGCAPGRLGWPGQGRRNGCPERVLLEQMGKISHLLLQRGDLGLRGVRRSTLFCAHRGDGFAGEGERVRASGATFWHRCPGDDSPRPKTRRSWGNSFRVMRLTSTRANLTNSWENSQELCREKAGEPSQEDSMENSQEPSWQGQRTNRLSRLFRGGDDDSTPPNSGGCAETSTSDRSGVPQWERAR
jgi:hypothetical protein